MGAYNKIGKDYSFLAIDLGTANTIAYVAGQGIVFNEPSLMAYDVFTNTLIGLGYDAYKMIGKTHEKIKIVSPLVDGVISDMDAAKDLLQSIFDRLRLSNVWKNSIVVLACPSGVTELEKSALKEIAKKMGATYALVEEEVKMAAVGAGVNIDLPEGNLIVDIGGGTTDAAIISAGDIVISQSVKVAGKQFDSEIRRYVRSEYNVIIGSKTSEAAKKNIGSIGKLKHNKPLRVFGRDVITGLPREVLLKPVEIKNVLLNPFSKITDLIVEILEKTPPELAGDIIKNGIIVCGGGAMIRGISEYFESIFQLKVKVSPEPLLSVIAGAKVYERNLGNLLEKIKIIDSQEYKID